VCWIALARARQHTESDKGIEEVLGGTRMELETCGKCVAVQRPRGECCEKAQLHGAEEGFRAPKGNSKIDDGCRTQGWTHSQLRVCLPVSERVEIVVPATALSFVVSVVRGAVSYILLDLTIIYYIKQ
jgi:hypothetical protein